jgi:hypothetical protein
MISKIHPCCKEAIIAATIPTAITGIRGLEKLRTYFRFISVTVQSTLRA